MRGLLVIISVFWSVFSFGQELKLGLPVGHRIGETVKGAVFSPNSKLIATYEDNRCIIWEINTLKPIIHFKCENIQNVQFDNRSELIFLKTYDTVLIYSLLSGKELIDYETKIVFSDRNQLSDKIVMDSKQQLGLSSSLEIIDVLSGEEIGYLDHNWVEFNFPVLRNNKMFLMDATQSKEVSLDFTTGRIGSAFEYFDLYSEEGDPFYVDKRLFIEDTVAVCISDYTSDNVEYRIHRAMFTDEIKGAFLESEINMNQELSKNGLDTINFEKRVILDWSSKSGYNLNYHPASKHSFYQRDSFIIINDGLSIFEVLEGSEIRFSKNGDVIIIENNDLDFGSTFQILSERGNGVFELDTIIESDIYTGSFSSNVAIGAFSYIEGGTIEIKGIRKSNSTFEIETNSSSIFEHWFSNNDSTLVVVSDLGIQLWDIVSKKKLLSFPLDLSINSKASFSKDGQLAAFQDSKNNIYVYNLDSNRITQKIAAHLDKITFIEFSENNTYLNSYSEDGLIGRWNLKNPELSMRALFLNDETAWVHIHSSGLFDASPEAMELMYWTKGLEIIDFSQLKDRYWLPGLWGKVMRGEQLPDVRGINELKLQPKVTFGKLDNGKLPIKLTKRDGGYGKISIFINGKEVISDARGDDLDSSKVTQTVLYSIKDHPYLVNGENEIVVKASSADGFVQGRGNSFKTHIEKRKSKPQFFGVVIGVGEYANSSINLKYPIQDASAISTSLQLGAENLFGVDRTFVYSITSEGDKKPTKQNIKTIFDNISQTAKPEDVIVIYLSGHGVTWGGNEGDFYFLTSDATAANKDAYGDPVIRKNNTVSTAEWVEMLKSIAALKQVMIIDACGSGKAVDNLIASRDVEASQVKAIDRMKDRTGMYIISGCTADAVSYEASQYGQGLLTYSILEAMKGAGIKADGSVDVDLMMQHARERVPVLAKGVGGIQQPQLLAPKGGSFDIGILDETDKKAIPLANPKKVFVRSTLVDSEEFEDVLGLSDLLDEELISISSKGAESKIVYFDAKKYPNACKISGGYTVEDEVIKLSLKIRCGEELEKVELKANSKEELVKKIIKLME